MYHERHRRDDDKHHHRNGVEQDTHIKVQVAKGQPSNVVRHYFLEYSVYAVCGEVFEGSEIREERYRTQTHCADNAGRRLADLTVEKSEQ